MAEHPNVAVVRKGYEAFDKGDFDTLHALFADDIVFHIPGDSQFSGDYKGQDEVFGMFAKLVQFTEGTLKNGIHDVLANDQHAVVILTATAKANGKSYSQREVHVAHMSGGKITEWWNFEEDVNVGNAFFGK